MDDSTKKCVVQNCKDFHEITKECINCKNRYFLENKFLCSPYSNDLICKEYNKNNEMCITCPENYKMVNQKCIEKNTCKKKESNGKCKKCNDGYKLNVDSNTCKFISACRQLDTSQNNCLECEDGYIMDSASSFCVLRLAKNCATVSLEKDQCETCLPKYFSS